MRLKQSEDTSTTYFVKSLAKRFKMLGHRFVQEEINICVDVLLPLSKKKKRNYFGANKSQSKINW